MYLQSLKLLWPTVKEMHLQENALLDLELKVKGGQGHTKCCPVPSTSYDLCTNSLILTHPMVKEKMHLHENTLFDLDL